MHAVFRKKIILFISVFFLTACGIKVLQLIDPPTNSINPNIANGSQIDEPEIINKITFTAANLNATSFINPGTDIFYRIYTSQEDLQHDANLINNANSEDSENGYHKLISLDYKEMRSTDFDENPLVDKNGGTVTITLANKDGESASISANSHIPLRYNGQYFNFNSTYMSDSSNYEIPQDGDSDLKNNSLSITHYYVNLYAASTGMDTTIFKPVYSQLLSLGFLCYEAK